MKKAIVLGGGVLQFDFVISARKFGYKVILCDSDSSCFCRALSDEFVKISTGDKEAVLELAKNRNPSIVHSIVSEVANVTACYVSEHLGLRSNSYDTARATTEKDLMKEKFVRSGIPTGKVYGAISEHDDTLKLDVRYPVIVKPADNSAGRGVMKVNNSSQLEPAIRRAFSFSRKKLVIIEEYIAGRQYSVETLSCEGRHQVVTVTEEYCAGFPHNIETQQCLPARLESSQETEIKKMAIKVLDEFDIQYGACHIEVLLEKNDRVSVIEIASRMGGWRSELIYYALGIDYSQLVLLSLNGQYRDVKSSRNDYSVVKMLINEEDVVRKKFFRETYPESFMFEYLFPGKDRFVTESLGDSAGYYFLYTNKSDLIDIFLER